MLPVNAAIAEIRPRIDAAAMAHGLDADIVAGLIVVESSGSKWAWNPEPRYRYFWNVRTRAPFRLLKKDELDSEAPPGDFPCLAGDPDQEWWAQQASWGLMQIMGALARELGFDGKYLGQICEVPINLELGCKHLRGLLTWAKGDIEQALAAYNGGHSWNRERPFRHQPYATKVLRARDALRS